MRRCLSNEHSHPGTVPRLAMVLSGRQIPRRIRQGKRRKLSLVCTCFCFFILAFVLELQTQSPPFSTLSTSAPTSLNASASRNDFPLPLKQILYYNSFWNSTHFNVGFGQEPFLKCRVKSCFATSKSVHAPSLQNLSSFDAIVIHGINFFLDYRVNHYIRSWRKPHQRFVFFMMEPPPNGPQFTSPIYNFFWNYTMTYRTDSDVPMPYGFIAPKVDRIHGGDLRAVQILQTEWPVDFNATDFIKNVLPNKGADFFKAADKPKKVAWVASRCKSNSHREEFVQELKKYIEVDVFGKCGTPCDVSGARPYEGNCSTQIMGDYKFYLSLENNFARDYVTEKFFMRMNDGLVPIVLGQANYCRIAPPHSFINALDYDSPKALADFLLRLDKNDTEYLSYFWWKDHYNVVSQDLAMRSFCDLCAKLNEDVEPHSYPDFKEWWHTNSQLHQTLPQLLSLISNHVPSN